MKNRKLKLLLMILIPLAAVAVVELITANLGVPTQPAKNLFIMGCVVVVLLVVYMDPKHVPDAK